MCVSLELVGEGQGVGERVAETGESEHRHRARWEQGRSLGHASLSWGFLLRWMS